jgi:hypothetical protein
MDVVRGGLPGRGDRNGDCPSLPGQGHCVRLHVPRRPTQVESRCGEGDTLLRPTHSAKRVRQSQAELRAGEVGVSELHAQVAGPSSQALVRVARGSLGLRPFRQSPASSGAQSNKAERLSCRAWRRAAVIQLECALPRQVRRSEVVAYLDELRRERPVEARWDAARRAWRAVTRGMAGAYRRGAPAAFGVWRR